MPPYKQPQTLNTLCLKLVNQLIITSCLNISKKHVNYDDSECLSDVNFVQEYLLSKIPGLVLNEVCLFNKCECKTYSNDSGKIGLLLSRVYMHKSMKQLDATRFRPNMLTHLQSSDLRSQILLYEQFWILHIGQLTNLVDLNLHLICTDAILQVVGENCHNLQRINIVSRRSEPSRKNRHDFNALKIKFCVSDIGLKYLSKCTELNEVIMNSILSKNFEGSMTISGIRSLVKSLPKLERISYNDMGTVLVEGMEDVISLPLLSLTCQSTTPNHIQAISHLCPHLNSLVLHSPYSTTDDYVEIEILQALAASPLPLTTLDLRKFQLSAAVWNLLRAKGNLLKSLWLTLRTAVCTQDVENIGIACPNLSSLHLFILASDSAIEYQYDPSRPLFRKLECLCLGVTWLKVMSHVSFSEICLSHAMDIRHVVLLESQGSSDVNAMWTRIMHRNPMRALDHLIVNMETPFNWPTVATILSNCPRLVVLTLPDPKSVAEREMFNQLQEDIQLRNLDLEFNISEVVL